MWEYKYYATLYTSDWVFEANRPKINIYDRRYPLTWSYIQRIQIQLRTQNVGSTPRMEWLRVSAFDYAKNEKNANCFLIANKQ